MKLTKHVRNYHVISEVDYDAIDGVELINPHDHGSINQAKKESHKLQMQLDGALGRGSLRVG